MTQKHPWRKQGGSRPSAPLYVDHILLPDFLIFTSATSEVSMGPGGSDSASDLETECLFARSRLFSSAASAISVSEDSDSVISTAICFLRCCASATSDERLRGLLRVESSATSDDCFDADAGGMVLALGAYEQVLSKDSYGVTP